MSPTSELGNLQRRVAAQRDEISRLKEILAGGDTPALRAEAAEYRKALSNILYRLDHGPLADDDLRGIVAAALDLRGVKPARRAAIADAHPGEEESCA